ncbi:hypothetical protein BJX63DRAFT_417668 [Aspergillus granulosus]|uniref:Cellobiose dehydrogenase-like cytochrome domain-containing protein n=1 Tax=Aspergillus granulosus TaxID=176169 RepID=A0ABR4I6P3_9EURO
MHFFNTAANIFAIAITLLPICSAQAPMGVPYTDPETDITFSTWTIPGPLGLTFGLALPDSAREVDATDFTGYLKCTTTTGWCGISLGGAMTDSLLLVMYADLMLESESSVAISPRYTSTYTLPEPYTGNATITPLSTYIDKPTNSFTTIFTCTSCLHWSQNGTEGGAKTSSGMLDLAWAVSPEKPVIAADGQGLVGLIQHERQGTWVAEVR